ncbi:MAG: prolyl-tRNA synthetase associated domain-containing protein [Clostridia bacterium]|nr:prolyl-tRNA synthetase associated domain-containing protein [Clostridia bacterium]
MNFLLYDSRPNDKRSRIEEQVYDTLEKLDIQFKRIDHSPAATINECAAIEKFLDVHICKNIFLTNNKKDVYCLLLLKGDKKYEAGIVSRQIGSSRLSFASDGELMRYLGTTPGSVSVLSLINDTENKVTVAVDSDLLKNEYIGCHPCKNTSTLKIKTGDITEKFITHINHQLIIINV